MVQIPFRRAAAASLALITVLCGTTDITAAGAHRISIRIYDTTTREAGSRDAAIELTTSILAQAGITTDWRDCSGGSARCEDVRRKGELVLRIVPTHVTGYAPAAGSIATRRSVNDTGLSLAFAVVEPRARIGVLATVFLDRVQLVAGRAGVPPSALLGRTIAHEIGHLLLGTMGHSREGLMREVWTDDELVADKPDHWLFSAPDRKKMISGIKHLR